MITDRSSPMSRLGALFVQSATAKKRTAISYVFLVALSMCLAAGVSAITSPAPLKSTAQPACSKDGIVACRTPRPS